MQKKTKLIGNIIFMLLLLGATMYLLLKDQDLPEIRRLLQGASGSMILFAVLCAVMYLILESTSLIVILRSLGERMHFFPSLRYSFIGFLFNALTPSASGGQPMMVLYMKADGINMGASSVAMLFWTIIYKIALVIVEAIVVLFYHPLMVRHWDIINGCSGLGWQLMLFRSYCMELLYFPKMEHAILFGLQRGCFIKCVW